MKVEGSQFVPKSKVDASNFVPKSKVAGSWDPNALTWTEHQFYFTSQSWGIKAVWEKVPGSDQPKFTFPLIITEVRPGSEAEQQGLRVRDEVMAVRPEGDAAYREVKRQDKDPRIVSSGKATSYVDDETCGILMRGGRCAIKIRRGEKTQRCECGSDEITEDERQGDLICLRCGVVLRGKVMSMSSEWRTFKDDESGHDPNRAGAADNPLLSSDGMSTMIGASGPVFGPVRNAADLQSGSAANLAKNQFKGSNQNADRAILDAFGHIERMCERLGLPRMIISAAQEMYKVVDEEQKKGKKVGRTVEATVCSVVYLACAEKKVPRTLKELCSVTTSTKKDIGKTFKHIEQLLGKKSGPTSAVDIIPRFSSHLQLSNDLERLSIHIARAAEPFLPGRVYTSVAGAAIYMACLLAHGTPAAGGATLPSAKQISDATGAAEATIRQVYRDMHVRRHALLPAGTAAVVPGRIDSIPDH
uniref:Transcription initiation factor IIB n=1 Tax=Cryptomonas curvata TaxID=233186 RepID=A0A7S0QK00_9CRYP|mmetsp:Transcript_3004/g.6532  ORF Transcript_3004/g.6532 Transcript_3004/m.6532 type:complete len:473 (+) Transcript_3004:68-1486(+)